MATRRNWITTGQGKSATASIASATANTVGTDYPQVGDLVYCVVACDNTSATAPQHTGSGPTISGAGAAGPWTTKQRTSGMSSTGSASTQLIVMYARVTTAFTSATVLTTSLSSSPVARTIGAFAFSDCNDPTGETGPAQGTFASVSSSVPGSFNVSIAGATNSGTAIGGTGTSILSTGTSGGSTASNVLLQVRCDFYPNGNSATAASVDGIYSAEIPPLASTFPWADAYVWDGSTMIAGDLYQWDGTTLQPLDVFGVV